MICVNFGNSPTLTDSGRGGAQRSGIKEEPEGRGTAAALSTASS